MNPLHPPEDGTTIPPLTLHRPVLLDEMLEFLALKEGGVYLDGTVGGGGHTLEIARRIGPTGIVIGLDRDSAALDLAQARIQAESPPGTVRYAQADYRDFSQVLELLGLDRVDGFLLDLGLSSDQLADRSRGFSFDADGEFDLRFDSTEGSPAWELLNQLSAERLADSIFQYGEERFGRRIAREIVRRRADHPIRLAAEVAEICRRVIPPSREKNRIDPATRTFQALRIVVNDELGALEQFLAEAPNRLAPGGRIAVISFHSLEDRIVKNAFRDSPSLEVLTRKPVEAGEAEKTSNPRSRSAKLRVAQRPANR